METHTPDDRQEARKDLSEEIIAEILRNQRSLPTEAGCKKYRLAYGSKTLDVTFKQGECCTYIAAVGSDDEALPHETTYLYAAAKRLMQAEADTTQKTVEYWLRTNSEKMKRWALGEKRGKRVFEWNDVSEDDDGTFTFRARADIKPTES